MKKAKKIVGILLIATLVLSVWYIASGIYSYFRSDLLTSFPWWSAFPFAAIYFGPWLLLEAAIYGFLVWKTCK